MNDSSKYRERKKIYSLKIVFRKNTKNEIFLNVKIRTEKIGKDVNIKFRDFSEYTNYSFLSDLDWRKYRNDAIAVYFRKKREDSYVYLTSKSSLVSTSFAQKLEGIADEAIKKINNKSRYENVEYET